MNETELFNKYKSSYKQGLFDFSLHMLYTSLSIYYLWQFRNSWLSVITILFHGLLDLKMFQIFHDCGHNSYTPNKTLNYCIGLLLSGRVCHPFFWNYNHAVHHKINGNAENKHNYNFNETVLHTKKQYNSWSFRTKWWYKILRMPALFFTIVIYAKMLIAHQFRVIPFILYKTYDCTVPKAILFIEQLISTTLFIAMLYTYHLYGILGHYFISCCFSFTITVMIAHNEHTYNPAYVVGNKEWSYKNSGLKGSSLILIPRALKYFFHGVEYHHIHHMNAKIPGYNLRAYHEEVVRKSNMFDNIVTLSMSDCYNNLWLVLYDEEKKRYITFVEADAKSAV